MAVGSYLHAQGLQNLPVLKPSYSHDLLQGKEGWKLDCIRNVYSDSQGRLWLKTCGQAIVKGIPLVQYDGYRHELPKPVNLENPAAYQLKYFDVISDNQLFGTYTHPQDSSRGIFLMDLTTRNIHFLLDAPLEQEIFDVRYMADSTLLVSGMTTEKIFIQVLKENELDTLMVFPNPRSLPNYLIRPEYKILYQGETLWFYFNRLPLVGVNLVNKSVRTYTLADFPEEDQLLLSQALARQSKDIHFTVRQSGSIYIRVGPHFFRLDEDKDLFFRIEKEFPNFGLAVGLYQDQQENICFVWENKNRQLQAFLEDSLGGRYDYSAFFKDVSTSDLKAVMAKDFFQEVWISETGSLHNMYVQKLNAIQLVLDHYFISSILELPDGPFLVNTVSDGWFQLSADFSQFQVFDGPSPCVPNPFTAGMVQQIIPDSQGSLWLVQHYRLYNYRPASGVCEAYEISSLLPRGPFDLVLFANLGNGKFVFTNWINELLFIDLKEGKSFTPGGSVPQRLKGKIYDFLVGKGDILWIPTSDGLWKIDWKNQTGTRIGIESGFEEEAFQCIYQAESGKLWLGSSLSGIYLYDPEKNLIERRITQDQGLTYNSIMSIFPDRQGDVWITTENGMNLLSPKGEVITVLYDNEGLNDNLFARFDPFVARDGRLLVGTQKGLNVIDPEAIKAQLRQDQEKKKIFLTELSYYQADAQKMISTQAYALVSPKVHLLAAHRNLTISYGISAYVEPNRHNYAYRLSGIDSSWNYLGPQHTLTLASLPAGQYTLQIKGSDFRNNWSTNMLEIPIQAEEFFYHTIWFFLLCTLPFLLFGLAWIYRVQREKVVLEATVAERTHQIRKDKDLIEAQAEQLRELDQFKSRFFTNISHEFRTPLTVIKGMVQQVRSKPEAWGKKGLDLIERNSTNLLHLINQILDLRKLESGKLHLNQTHGDILKALSLVAASFESMAESKDIELQIDLEPQGIMMDFDPAKLGQITKNLLSNAIKFTPPGGYVALAVQREEPQQLKIQISDTGRGIPAEKLPYIFDRFYQVDGTTTRDGEGTGIGLSLARELVQLMGGQISVQSTEGAGSTFTVLLPITQTAPLQKMPVVQPQEEIPPSPLPSNVSSQGEGDRPRLLIIEDNPDIVAYLYSLLEDQYALSSAPDGQQGIEDALEQVPDLIIADVMMPQKNGYEVTETLKLDERTSHIPIVMLTAKADHDSRMEGYKRGADAYLAKPFQEEELFIRLEKLLEIRRTLQRRYQGGKIPTETPIDNPAIQVEDIFLSKARQAIIDHLDDSSYRGNSLSNELAMSRANLHRKLKALTGLSTSHFIRTVRLEEARKLLAQPELQVAEVAYATGFNDPNYFNRVFSEAHNCSPTEWRTQHSKKK